MTGGTDSPGWSAAVVVLADEHGGREYSGDAALALLRRTLDASPRAVVVAAGAGQLSTLEQARELGVRLARLVGSAPLAAQSIAAALTAMELDASVDDVSLAIVGTPPSLVIAWTDATLAGSPLTPLLSPPKRSGSSRGCGHAGRPAVRAGVRRRGGGPAIGSASHRRLTCFVARDGAYERRPFAALPVTLGPGGVVDVHGRT